MNPLNCSLDPFSALGLFMNSKPVVLPSLPATSQFWFTHNKQFKIFKCLTLNLTLNKTRGT